MTEWLSLSTFLPIISAVGHETDFTIADFVADLRAPTPSAAAELAVADVEEIKYTIGLYNRRLKMALQKKTEVMRLRYDKVMSAHIFRDPLYRINDYYIQIDKMIKSIENASVKKVKDSKIDATRLITKLDTLSPLKTLIRGYCIAESDGKMVSKAKDLKKDMELDLRFQDGNKKARVL